MPEDALVGELMPNIPSPGAPGGYGHLVLALRWGDAAPPHGHQPVRDVCGGARRDCPPLSGRAGA